MATDYTIPKDEYRKLIAELDQLKTSNAELHHDLEMLVEGYGSKSREHSQLILDYSDALKKVDELSELVRQLWECPVDANKCTDCPHCKRHYDVCAGENHCRLYDRMKELGVCE